MNRSLHILHLEDDFNDAELIKTALEEDGLRFDVTCVETKADFLGALALKKYNIILADYKLPSFDGLSALAIAQEKTPDVPFIFVSGVMGEELAIDTLKNGATDYVLKQRLSRLAPAVRRALKEAKEFIKSKQAEKALQESEARYKTLFENMQSGVAIYRAEENGEDFIFVDFNKAGENIDNIKKSEIIGKSILKVFPAIKDFGLFDVFHGVWATGEPAHHPISIYRDNRIFGWRSNIVYKLPSGEIVAVYTDETKRKQAEEELKKHHEHLEELVQERTAELRTKNEQLKHEITERRRAEEKLRRTADELARSNADLTQFAAIVSHDLQEPLRVIGGFVRLLARRYAGRLDEKADKFIGFTIEGVNRMQELIKDLLEYSKVGTLNTSLKPVDFSVAMDKAVLNLKAAIEDVGALVTHDQLPAIIADISLISRLFQNLIGNAVKFHGKEPMRVHVAAKRNKNMWVFSVQDNGIGIEPKHAEKIFGMFQRLHTTQEYPGTGIGLAICKRIVEHHGGEIWLESESGKGSTFYFSMPDRPSPMDFHC